MKHSESISFTLLKVARYQCARPIDSAGIYNLMCGGGAVLKDGTSTNSHATSYCNLIF